MLETTNINVGGGKTPKTLQPGNAMCTINAITLEEFKFKDNAYHIILHLEGPDLGKEFEGFFIDKADEKKGRHKGQVGQVKVSQWAYADGVTGGGTVISRDTEMLKCLKSLCLALDLPKWLDNQNNKHATIESLFEAFNTEKPFLNKPLYFCIGGKEYYTKKNAYVNYDLHLPKFIKNAAPYSKTEAVTFDAAVHIVKAKIKPEAEFGDTEMDTSISDEGKADFTL